MAGWFTIHEAAAALRRGEVSSVDLVKQCFAQIERWESRVHAWVMLDGDGALARAGECDGERQAGRDRGPLHGIPLGTKDIFDIADWPTAAGSKRWANSIAREDCEIVRRLRHAGAIFLGKTVTTAFASFDPPITRNPWNLERTPGGSSSGSAAALATGMCLGAMGSQTGGSITRPASYCGVAGLKPSYGLLPLEGILPLAASMDHPGPMARCVRDLRLMMDALAGPALRAARLPADFPLRFGRARGLFDRFADPAVRSAMDECCERLRTAGAVIEDVVLPAAFEEVIARHRIVMAVESAAWHRDRFRRHPEDYPTQIRTLIEEGLACPAADYALAKEHQRRLTEEMDAFLEFAEVAFLLTPATTCPAPSADTTGNPAFNSPWSYTGLPTVSFPTGQMAGGLPLALQIVGPRFAEADLLNLGERCESALAVKPRMPPGG